MNSRKMLEWIRYIRWRWISNFQATWQFSTAQTELNAQEVSIVEALRRRGITKVRLEGNENLLNELTKASYELFQKAWDFEKGTVLPDASDNKNNRSNIAAIENKDFLRVLTPKKLDSESIFIRFALQPSFIRIANHYLGMNAELRAVALWMNYANGGEPSSTQLWHRDGDDFLNVKIFTYLSEVKESNGPFMFIPGTQHLGPLYIEPVASEFGRTTDAEMLEEVEATDWEQCVGQPGDIVFADTTGFHNGSKPKRDYNLMLMVHYASPKALSGKDIEVEGLARNILTSEQRKAISGAL